MGSEWSNHYDMQCASRSLWRSSLGLLILCMTRWHKAQSEKEGQMGQIASDEFQKPV